MRQPICSSGSISASPSNHYVGLFNSSTSNLWTFTEAVATAPWIVAGTMRKLRVRCTTAPGGATAHVLTLIVNGSPSALTCTVSGAATSATDLVNSVALNVGDTVSLLRDATGGSPATAVIHWSMEFESTVANESCYVVWGTGTLQQSQDMATGLFGGYYNAGTTEANYVAAAGAITRYDVKVVTAPGVGFSHDFVIKVNGVAQDGSGGTPDTRISVVDANTTGTATFTLNLTAGQEVGVSGTAPAGTATTNFTVGTKFVATTDGQSQFCRVRDGNLGAATVYAGNSMAPWTTEADATGPISGAFWLWGVQVFIATAPGAGKSWTVTLRKNSAAASPTPSIVRTGTTSNLLMADTNSANAAAYADGDTYSAEAVPAGSPANSQCYWTMIASDVDPAVAAGLATPLVNGGLVNAGLVNRGLAS